MRYTIQNSNAKTGGLSINSLLSFIEGFFLAFYDAGMFLIHLIIAGQPFFTVVIAAATFTMVVRTYRFNHKRNSFSHLSIKAMKLDRELTRPTVKSDELITIDYCNYPIGDNDFYIEDQEFRFTPENGYCSVSEHHKEYDWFFEIKNIGNFSSTDIELSYEIEVTKLQVTLEEEYKRISIDPLRIHGVSREVHIPYMAADETKRIFVSSLRGEFPSASITITSLRSNELEFITETTVIDSYIHPTLLMANDHKPSLYFALSGMEREDYPYDEPEPYKNYTVRLEDEDEDEK